MDNFSSLVLKAVEAMNWLEVLAVATSVAYLVLAAKESLWCWFFALVSVVCYTIILLDAQLYAETALQGYYGIMAVYGFYQWKNKSSEDVALDQSDESSPILLMSIKQHFWFIILILAGTALTGFLLSNYTNAAIPYLDAFTTVGALFTTWLVTKKYIDNWLYWIVVDGAGIYLYFNRELYLTALLFIAYVIIVIFGFFNWREKLNKTNKPTS
jgi:nicotinamide mononucleotide transporter